MIIFVRNFFWSSYSGRKLIVTSLEDTSTTAFDALRKGLEDLVGACDVVNEKFVALMNAGVEQLHSKIGPDLVPVIVAQASGLGSIGLPESLFHPESIRLRRNEDPQAEIENRVWYKLMMPERLREEFSVVSRVLDVERCV